MKVAIIGMGGMGSKYAGWILKGEVAGMELVACTRVNDERRATLGELLNPVLIYNSADDLYKAYDDNEFDIDGVIVVTPHYSHEDIAIKAFKRGLSVLSDKPAGVYSRQARNMMEAYKACKDGQVYGYVFHQRTFPMYRRIKEILDSKQYGDIKRVNWVVTDWYRSNAYYKSSPWRATWAHDGGGTLLNQCPHNLDLLQYLCGMPSSVYAVCHEGKFHDIEVEDEATLYMEWDNGVTGVFIASTGEGAGVNRLEITLDDALIICENGAVKLKLMDKPEIIYRNGPSDMFSKPKTYIQEVEIEPNERAYEKLLENFASCYEEGSNDNLVAAGDSAIYSLYLSNAAYLSSWEGKKIQIPTPGTAYELEFEKEFEAWLSKKSK